MGYTVKELAELAGVTVRTLHHYDHIGLLSPAYHTENGYRYYDKAELQRLQQVLFFRELDFSLDRIKEILDSPIFDLNEALYDQKRMLRKKIQRLKL